MQVSSSYNSYIENSSRSPSSLEEKLEQLIMQLENDSKIPNPLAREEDIKNIKEFLEKNEAAIREECIKNGWQPNSPPHSSPFQPNPLQLLFGASGNGSLEDGNIFKLISLFQDKHAECTEMQLNEDLVSLLQGMR